MKLTWPQVHAWRLRRQHLDPPGNATALVLAKALAGVQAQVMSAAELAVAVRQEKSQAGEVRRALWEDRSLVKTWAMRGTLHLLPAREAGAYLTLMASLKPWEKGSWQKAFGATPKDLEGLRDAALEALDGRSLTREQLTEKVGSSHLKEFLRSGWGTLLKPLAWWGALCHGPSEGNRVTSPYTQSSFSLVNSTLGSISNSLRSVAWHCSKSRSPSSGLPWCRAACIPPR